MNFRACSPLADVDIQQTRCCHERVGQMVEEKNAETRFPGPYWRRIERDRLQSEFHGPSSFLLEIRAFTKWRLRHCEGRYWICDANAESTASNAVAMAPEASTKPMTAGNRAQNGRLNGLTTNFDDRALGFRPSPRRDVPRVLICDGCFAVCPSRIEDREDCAVGWLLTSER
jgi:hypothetical protein